MGRASALTPVQTRTMPAQPQSTEPTVHRSAETVTRPLEQRMQSIMEHSSASRVVKAAAFSRNRGMSRMFSPTFSRPLTSVIQNSSFSLPQGRSAQELYSQPNRQTIRARLRICRGITASR